MTEINQPPGPTSYPLIDTLPELLRFGRDPLQVMSDLRAQHGDVVKIGKRPLFMHPQTPHGASYLLFGEAHNQRLMSETDLFHQGPIIGRLMPQKERGPRINTLTYLGSGLFGVNGETHARQRRLMMPAFHKQRIAAYQETMVAYTQQQLDRWQPGETRNIHQEMMTLTLLIAGKTLFDVDFSGQAEGLGASIQTWLRLVSEPQVTGLPFDLPLLPFYHFINASVEIDSALREVIDVRRRSGVDKGDVLSMLLTAADEGGAGFTEEELIGHAHVLFVAGHETSSNALTWTLLLLAQHPEVAAALDAELSQVLQGASPTLEQLSALPLLERVIKESMRILPPVPTSARMTTRDTEIGGYPIPAGSEVAFSHYHTHHDATLFPQPERFDPQRWLTIKPSPYAYMPFSAGRRMCIGASFALMEIKLVLTLLLQRYRLALIPDTQVDPLPRVTMGPKAGLPMVVHPADGQFANSRAPLRGRILNSVDFGEDT